MCETNWLLADKKVVEEEEKQPDAEPEAAGVIDLDQDAAKGPVVDKGEVIEKMKQQNAKLKKEFAALKDKLEECIEKAKRGGKPVAATVEEKKQQPIF